MKKSSRIKLAYSMVSVFVVIVVLCGVLSNSACVWASWYGPHFQGKRTANGEVFNMYKMTAASRTLPFGTVIKVTNCGNDRNVLVRINDRGPYKMDKRGNAVYPLRPHPYRALDLSYAAARRLGMLKGGVARVKIRVVSRPAGTKKGRQT